MRREQGYVGAVWPRPGWLLFLGGLVVLLGLGPVTCSRSVVAPGTPAALEAPVWPPSPARARIRWLAEITGPEDLGIRPGVFRRVWDWMSGKQAPRLVRPHGVAVDPRGRVWITDPGARRVHVLDAEEGTYRALDAGPQTKMSSPIGVAHDTRGTAYVSDSKRAVIFRFDAKGRVLPSWDAGGEFVRPTGLAYDRGRGLLWVADAGAHRLLALGVDGTVRHSVGERGEELGHFNFPTHVGVDGDGRVYVTDTLNFRVQVLSPSGAALFALGQLGAGPGALSRPKGIGVDRDGHVYVVDALFDNVQVFDDQGRTLLYFGEAGSGPGEFWLPAGLHIADGHRIYVVDSYNQRVQVFDYLGS